jgi:multidrug resistance protein, MATE family
MDKVTGADTHNFLQMALLHESRLTLRLAFPLMIGQLSQMLLGVADTLMVGHLGVTELAALTLVNSLVYIPFVFGIGLLTGVSVFTSNSQGANDCAGARGSCRHGLYLGLALGLILFGIGWLVSLQLAHLGQPTAVAARATHFFRIIMASLIPALAAMALKNHADALQRPWPPFWIFLGGVVLNVGLNWVMIHGKFRCPALGMEGAAWATLISRTCILAAMILWLLRAKGLREWVPYRWFRTPDFTDIRRLLSVGFPASLQMLCEVSAFSMAGLIMGRFGQSAMAAHQIAITLAGTAFMIPLGLSMALTVQIGRADGAGEQSRLRPIILSGWILAAGYSLVAAGVFLIFGKFLASRFIHVPEVISLASSLLVVVGVFQLVDSIQVASSAMLRGLQDARVPAVMGFTAYWLVGLPVAAGLAFVLKMAALGVWWGLAVGLFIACITLAPRLWSRTRGAISPR